MRVVDTSAWVEWAIGSEVGRQIVPLLPDAAQWLVPTIIQYELAKWEMRVAADPEHALELVAFSRNCLVVPLTTALAVEAASVGRQHQLAAADSIVYATARRFDADVLTCDAHFRRLPGVIYFEKSNG
jgi:predicted nucleic acid-binding protein